VRDMMKSPVGSVVQGLPPLPPGNPPHPRSDALA
jgi:hypothetical protein